MASAFALVDVVQCVVSSSLRLIQGRSPYEVASNLLATINDCAGDEALAARVIPLKRVLSVEGGPSSVERQELAWALYATTQNLANLPDELANVQDMVDTAGVRLREKIIQASEPPPILSGIFRRSPVEKVSEEVIERQLVATLRMTAAGVLHDTGNGITVIKCGIREIIEKAELIPFLETTANRIDQMDKLLSQAVQIIKRVQTLLQLDKETTSDLENLPKLFESEGFLSRVATMLDRVRKELAECGQDTGLRITTLPDNERELLSELPAYFATFQEFLDRILDLFSQLKRVVDGIDEERFGLLCLEDHLSHKMLSAVMSRGVEVTLDLEREPWAIRGSSIHIWQVILNLAVNARDAMKGSGKLEVRTRRASLTAAGAVSLARKCAKPLPRPGDYMVLSIGDDGPGISQDILPRIFDVSFSGKKSTGLGLSVLLEIVRQMGGFVVVETSTGQNHGTHFTFYFPRSI